MTDPCPGCGYKAGRTACQDLFNDIALRIRALAWTGSMQTWRLLHDVYDIQHEEDFCGRYKGLMMHLGGVCLALEHGGEERDYRKLQKFVELDTWKDKPYPPDPGIPAARGTITVANLEEAEIPERLIAGVDRWARAAWEAYKPLQPIAREWVKEALKQK